jgi:hypothetical protein
MKYSRKFYRANEKDEVLLYFMSILTLVQIFYLIMHKKYTFILLFFTIGIVLNFFVKNQSIVLIIDIIIINILLNIRKQEGMTTKPVPNKNVTPVEPDVKKPKKSSGVSKNASSVSAPTTLKPKENFDGNIGKNGQIEKVGEHIAALGNLMDKFSGLTSKLNLFGK